jgi:hypothetical protein
MCGPLALLCSAFDACTIVTRYAYSVLIPGCDVLCAVLFFWILEEAIVAAI